MTKKTCIIIGGPTAVGKTALSLALARHFHTSIVSADSRQCFRELNIGVAKPSEEELSQVKHYFINTHSLHDKVTAADFEQYALASLGEIFSQADMAIVVGGTGFYIKALMEGLDSIPEVPESIRAAVIRDHEEKGIEWLRDAVSREDPAFFVSGENRNPQRLMRALEVVRACGRSILEFRKKEKQPRPFECFPVRLALPREMLYQRIDERVKEMVDKGLEKEAQALYRYRQLNALQTVGYQEYFDHFDGKYDLPQTIQRIGQHTRQYAKRQETWFKKYLSADAFASDDWKGVINAVTRLNE